MFQQRPKLIAKIQVNVEANFEEPQLMILHCQGHWRIDDISVTALYLVAKYVVAKQFPAMAFSGHISVGRRLTLHLPLLSEILVCFFPSKQYKNQKDNVCFMPQYFMSKSVFIEQLKFYATVFLSKSVFVLNSWKVSKVIFVIWNVISLEVFNPDFYYQNILYRSDYVRARWTNTQPPKSPKKFILSTIFFHNPFSKILRQLQVGTHYHLYCSHILQSLINWCRSTLSSWMTYNFTTNIIHK